GTKQTCKKISLPKQVRSGQSNAVASASEEKCHGHGLCRNPHRRRRPGRADHEPHAEPALVSTPCARKGTDRRALAKRTLGWAQIPVSELVGAAARLPIPACRSRRFCRERRDRRLSRGLCKTDRGRGPLRRCRDRTAQGRSWQWLCCRDLGRADQGSKR